MKGGEEQEHDENEEVSSLGGQCALTGTQDGKVLCRIVEVEVEEQRGRESKGSRSSRCQAEAVVGWA